MILRLHIRHNESLYVHLLRCSAVAARTDVPTVVAREVSVLAPILVAIEVRSIEEEGVRLTRILARVSAVHLIARPALRTLVAVPLHREVHAVLVVRRRLHAINQHLLFAALLQSWELGALYRLVVAVGSRRHVSVLVLLVYLSALTAVAALLVVSTSAEGERREHQHSHRCAAQCVFIILLHLNISFKKPFYSFSFKQKRECVPYVYATTNGTHPQYSYSKIERVYLKYISRSFPYLRTFA